MPTRSRSISPLAAALVVLASSWVFVACTEESDFLTEHVHPEGWVGAGDNSHGDMVLQSANKAESCTTCHGDGYRGGTSGVSCYTCHASYPHPEGFAAPPSSDFHEQYFISTANWELAQCQSCHGSDYAGRPESAPADPNPQTIAAKDCQRCHAPPDGPEACNTCHGDADRVAPPEDLFKNTASGAIGVGAHTTHLGESDISQATGDCTVCHVVPAVFDADGHVDTPLPAEVTFGGLAVHQGPNAEWDRPAASCTGSYCHGGFVFLKEDSNNQWAYTDDAIVGNDPSVVWTNVGSGEAQCGSCHGLPPTGHVDATTCNACHPRVVDADFNIVDPALHINGEIEVF